MILSGRRIWHNRGVSAAELLAKDRFGQMIGAHLVSASEELVVLEMTLDDRTRDSSGRVAVGAVFSLADCAMSLISNASSRAVAVATHLTPIKGGDEARRLRVEIEPISPPSHRAVTWRAAVSADGDPVAYFTGTTLKVG